MTKIPNRLSEVAEQLGEGKQPETETVRTLLRWFDAKRRGYTIVQDIREALAELSIETQPDFESVHIDSPVNFVVCDRYEVDGRVDRALSTPPATSSETNVSAVPQTAFVGGAVAEPAHRISRLASANRAPVSVTPDSTLQEAVHLMMYDDLSQLPVMQGERDVKGMISWYSIGVRRSFGCSSDVVRDYMDPHQEIRADASLFEAIPLIVQHQYVLVRDAQNRISGIVTASDLSEQFGQLGEPFLLIGEVENHIRRLIVGRFTAEELAAHRDPADEEREVERVEDLTFGEYKRLLENPDHWSKLDLRNCPKSLGRP